MKSLFYAFLVIASVTSCKKQNANPTSIVGKWVLTERYQSSGGPGVWYPATGSNRTNVSFKDDGLITGNTFVGYTNYIVKDSVTVTMSGPDQITRSYCYKIEGNKLSMDPSAPAVCIEGCTIRFERD